MMYRLARYLLILTLLLSFGYSNCLFAQATEGDDSFDPFSDYNDFEQEAEEEADINFLRNGRYLALALVTGYRDFTGGFSESYTGGFNYGAQFSYFFDLNLALALGYTTGDHGVEFTSFNRTSNQPRNIYTGNVNIQAFDLQVKYYFNTDNVTKGLADLNPYILTGGAFSTRTYNLNRSFPSESDSSFGFRLGGGLEIPLLQRRFYLGLQAMYTLIQFADENNGFIDEGTDGIEIPDPSNPGNTFPVSPRLNGDFYELNVILGTSF